MAPRSSLKTIALLACTLMAGPSLALPQYSMGAESGSEAPEPTATTGGSGGGDACAVLASMQASVFSAADAAAAAATAGGAPPEQPIPTGDEPPPLPTLGPDGAVAVPAKIAMDCLNSLPFEKDKVVEFLNEVMKYFSFQSTLGALADPPKDSGQEPIDVMASMRQVIADVKSGKITTQYEVERQVSDIAGKTHDGHFNVQLGASGAIGFQFPIGLSSISEDGLKMPKIVLGGLGPSARDPDRPAFGPLDGPAVTEIDGMEPVAYLKNITNTMGFQAIDTRYQTAFVTNTVDGTAFAAGVFSRRNFHPGKDSVEMTFENGKKMSLELEAVLQRDDFVEIDSAEAFYKKFVLGGINLDGFPSDNCPAPPEEEGPQTISVPGPGPEATAAPDEAIAVLSVGDDAAAAPAPAPKKPTKWKYRKYAAINMGKPKKNWSKGPWKKQVASHRRLARRAMEESEEATPTEGEPSGTETPEGNGLTAIPTPFPVGEKLGPGGEVVESFGFTFFGTFLDDKTAVMSLADFEGCTFDGYQAAIKSFLKKCKDSGKENLILDMIGNPGGLVLTGFETFKQLFPAEEPRTVSRIRANPAAAIYAKAFSQVSEKDVLTDTDGVATDAAFSGYNAQIYRTEDGKNFTSAEQWLGPYFVANDNFTSPMAIDLGDNISAGLQPPDTVSGFGSLKDAAKDEPVFKPENMVILTDGICSSTCTILAEQMQQRGVKTALVGGLPQMAPAAAIGGVRGSETFPFGAFLINTQVMQAFPPESEEEQKMRDSVLPGNVTFSFNGQVNLRDALRKGEDTALQFLPDEANCRMFHTAETVITPVALYKMVADAAWGNGKCAFGSLKGGKTGGKMGGSGSANGTKQPPSAGGSGGCVPVYPPPSGTEPNPPEAAPTEQAPPEAAPTEEAPPSYGAPPQEGSSPGEAPPTYGAPPEEGSSPGEAPPTYGAPPEEGSSPSEMPPPEEGSSPGEMPPPEYGSSPSYGGIYRRI